MNRGPGIIHGGRSGSRRTSAPGYLDFAFELPTDVPPTDLHAPSSVYWQLLLHVPIAGPDLESVFLAPVYKAGKQKA